MSEANKYKSDNFKEGKMFRIFLEPLAQPLAQLVTQPLDQPVTQSLYMLESQALKLIENQVGESESWDLPLLERQVGESLSSDRMMLMRFFGDPETGKDSALRCSLDAVNLDSGKTVFFFFCEHRLRCRRNLWNR